MRGARVSIESELPRHGRAGVPTWFPYDRGSHTIYDMRYHLVWVTKYRYHVLTGEVARRVEAARRVRELVRQTCEAMGVRIVKGHVSKDHVHILVSCPTTVSPAELTGAGR